MNKKNTLYIILSILLAIILTAVTRITNTDIQSNEEHVNVPTTNKKVDKTPLYDAEKNEYYLVKYYDGRLNVYDSNNNIVDTITVDFDTMRDYDKLQFEKGVTLSNIDDVKHIAEDFSE